MARLDDEAPWSRTLLTGLGALAAVSLLVGGVVGAVAFGAAKLTGLGENAGGPSEEPSLYIPSGEPSTSPEAYPDPPEVTEPTPTAEPTPTPEPSPSKPPREISLQGYPATVSPGERINLTGVFATGEGATLQVQRFEGGWTDFPVTATVRGGTFTTYVMTSRPGLTRFRVVDTATGRASNPVRITIR
jgi:hypothetical protein